MAKNIHRLAFIAFILLAIVCISSFVPYGPAIEEARKAGFSIEQIALGRNRSFQSRILFWSFQACSFGLISWLALSDRSRRCADQLLNWTRGNRIFAVLGMGIIYILLNEVVSLPFQLGSYYLNRSWGMTNPSYTLGYFLQDHFLAIAVDSGVQAIVLTGFYLLLMAAPRTWWLIAPIAGGALGMAYAFLAPLWIDPLYNNFTPLDETPWKDMQPRVQALIESAKIPVREILVMDASRKGTHTNAYFAGFGSTRRIVLYDTLLKNSTPAEVESVLAHEIGHWQHDHIVQGMTLGIIASVIGFWILDRFLRSAIQTAPWKLKHITDPAGLWLIILLIYLGRWVVQAPENWISRHFERQADAVSLELAKDPEVFISSEQKLAIENQSNVAPSPWNTWIFSTHPPTVERIRMAKEWKP